MVADKGNSFQTIKASDTLRHQPMVWLIPYACAQPYHSDSGRHGHLYRPCYAWHSRRAEIGLRSNIVCPLLPRRLQSTTLGASSTQTQMRAVSMSEVLTRPWIGVRVCHLPLLF